MTGSPSVNLAAESLEAGVPKVVPDNRQQRLAFVAVAVSVLLWASAYIGIRAAGRGLSAGPLSMSRLLVASVVLGLLVIGRRESVPPLRDLRRLIVVGLLWFAAYSVMLNQAERTVDAGTAAMLVNLAPVIIALLGGAVLREGFPGHLLIGCFVALAGAALIGWATSRRGLDAGLGTFLCVAAAVVWAASHVLEKPLLRRSSALTTTWAACSVGAMACLPFAPQTLHELGRAGPGVQAWVIYLGVFPTAVGFSTWAYALARTNAGSLGAATYLVPPIAVLLGWLILGETPPPLAFVGGAVCLLGVWITRGKRLTVKPAAPPNETV